MASGSRRLATASRQPGKGAANRRHSHGEIQPSSKSRVSKARRKPRKPSPAPAKSPNPPTSRRSRPTRSAGSRRRWNGCRRPAHGLRFRRRRRLHLAARAGAARAGAARQPRRDDAAPGHRPDARHADGEHRALRQGLPANNALLWGARGMGKSSLVKAAHAQVNKAIARRQSQARRNPPRGHREPARPDDAGAARALPLHRVLRRPFVRRRGHLATSR